jgi:GT2 family glycosyltransferase
MERSDVHATPAVSVVMPANNAAATIGQQLEGLAGQTYQCPWELVIADNGSRDETVVITRRWADRIQRLSLVDAADRPGASYARNVGFLPYPLTANCGMRREIWTELGGFDERYHYGSDDVAFFWRVQLAGYGVGFAPEAIVHYRLRSKVSDMARQYYTYGKTHTMLYRDFAAAGMPRLTITALCRE